MKLQIVIIADMQCVKMKNDKVDCYVNDFEYFNHHVKDSSEAENCSWFYFVTHSRSVECLVKSIGGVNSINEI